MFSLETESASQPWSTPDLALWLVLIKESECGGRDVAGLDCVWTVVRRPRQYWKVTMAAPSYTNICPPVYQCAGQLIGQNTKTSTCLRAMRG